MKKNTYWIDHEEEEEYPDSKELEYQDRIQTSKKRNARLAKQESGHIIDLDLDATMRNKKNDKKI